MRDDGSWCRPAQGGPHSPPSPHSSSDMTEISSSALCPLLRRAVPCIVRIRGCSTWPALRDLHHLSLFSEGRGMGQIASEPEGAPLFRQIGSRRDKDARRT